MSLPLCQECLCHHTPEHGCIVGRVYKPFEPYWDTLIDSEPVYIESHSQKEKIMQQKGLQVRDREHIDDLNHRRWQKGLPPVRD